MVTSYQYRARTSRSLSLLSTEPYKLNRTTIQLPLLYLLNIKFDSAEQIIHLALCEINKQIIHIFHIHYLF